MYNGCEGSKGTESSRAFKPRSAASLTASASFFKAVNKISISDEDALAKPGLPEPENINQENLLCPV